MGRRHKSRSGIAARHVDRSAPIPARSEEDLYTIVEKEKNTLLLYTELMQFVPEGDRDGLHYIMDEERMHLTQLTRFKEQYPG